MKPFVMVSAYNTTIQECGSLRLRLIVYTERHFAALNAKRFMLMMPDGTESRQNIWIPNSYLLPDGTINPDKDLSWLYKKWENQHKLRLVKKEWEERR